ncbi:MAG TPA: HD domain-containing phosphohydrolase [Blastocatellia bacterium]|nr:HD domain-containing phosphohydrolase [Blastocatellia bacterium]
MRHKVGLHAKLFTWAVATAGVCALLYSTYRLWLEPVHLEWMVLLMVMVLVTWNAEIYIPGVRSKITLSDTFIYVCAFLLGPWAAVALGSVDAMVRSFRGTRRVATVGINLGAINLSVMAATLAAVGLFGPLDQLVHDGRRLKEFALALGIVALINYLINTGLVATSLALSRGKSIIKTWKEGFLWTSAVFFVGMLAAGLICKAIAVLGFYSFVISVPIVLLTYIAYRTYLGKVEASNKHIESLTKLHLAAIESLTMAIDAKDQVTRGHIQRVRVLAEGLGRACGYPEDQMEGLKAAALLHDIGKLAVPEHILCKPGKLSTAEFSKVMIHPVIGADILSNVEFPYEVVPIVKHHHEKYDGTGYPSGLEGEEIPLGARILTVVDCYDALTTNRPYRPCYTRQQALEIMRRDSGRTFDPVVLKTFFEVIDSIEVDLPPLSHRPVTIFDTGRPAPGRFPEQSLALMPKSRTEKALLDIAAAQREVLSLYEISQTLGSTLKLSEVLPIVAAKLENIANFTTLIIYLNQGEKMRASYVSGKHAAALKGIEIAEGEGETGWVARHRQVLIGSSPTSNMEQSLGRLDAESDDGIVVGRTGVVDFENALGKAAAEYRTTAIFPLLQGETLVGALALYSEENRGYSADEVRLLETISTHTAVAVSNALAFERTQESALTDNLTGLPNSRYMYSFFDQERSRADRQGYPLVMMMMDLDGFKKINDTYGHHIGDEILRRISQLVRRKLRMGDTLIRYAGDEFVAVLHRATPDMVDDLKRRLQASVDDFAHEVRPGRVARVGISIGHATYGEDGHAIDELMEVADQRMYEDKISRKRGALSMRVLSFPARSIG